MKTITTSLLIVVTLASSQAIANVSPNSAKLETLRQSIESNSTYSLEQEYLQAFPKTCSAFKKTFYGSLKKQSYGLAFSLDELYPKHEQHLALLRRLFETHRHEVIAVWLGVATHCTWEADALGYLQAQLAGFGAEDTSTLAAALVAKPVTERRSIIRFLADVENHNAYDSYKIITTVRLTVSIVSITDVFSGCYSN